MGCLPAGLHSFSSLGIRQDARYTWMITLLLLFVIENSENPALQKNTGGIGLVMVMVPSRY